VGDHSMRRFKGRVAVVSGAAQGMGKAVALRLGEEGATVIAVDINDAGAVATAAEIGGESMSFQCDIGDANSVSRLFAALASKAGRLDVLVNVAAIVPFVKWDELTFDEWRRVMRVNLDGLYLMCRAGSDMMRTTGYGRIVNFSSNSIFAGTPNMAHYVASKGGVLTFTRALATELGPYKITANSICPGLIDTEGVQRTLSISSKRFRRSRAGACLRMWFQRSRFSLRKRPTGLPVRRSMSTRAWCAGRRRQE
jgi:pyridoxal 4-dehydrogenase